MSEYNFKEIESKWQKKWDKSEKDRAEDFSKKPKHYHLVEFPYPSGEGLHVGHTMGYGASDAYCRMKRMQGYNVLFPIGWDAFGLPTENYAIKNKIKPSEATKKNILNFRRQMKSLGYLFNYDREVNTTDPNYYKWTQWIFLQFYRHAIVNNKLIEVKDDDKTTPRLAYQNEMPVNWCPSCKINLANEEVISGKCERCGTQTTKKIQKQWMLRITSYAERLIDDLQDVDYEDRIKNQQINWIGKSQGARIRFEVETENSHVNNKNKNIFIEVFTTRADTLFGCTYVVLAPEHPLIKKLKAQISNSKEIEDYINNAIKKTDIERTELEKNKTGVKLDGVKAINPINNREVGIYIADYVLINYGTGAAMAVPAHDKRDFEFAKKYDIEIIKVIQNPKIKSPNTNHDIQKADIEYGTLINSEEFNGLTSEEAKDKIIIKLKSISLGDFAINFKLRDWIFSRQHYWGEPIPIIHCEKCGTVPVSESDLPITLPDVENYEPTDTGKSPLSSITKWVNTTCPMCGAMAQRETDTMPNWAGSSWYYLRYTDPINDRELASMDKLKYWTPVDIYNGGMEHTTLHLLYSRFWHKFLYDLGVVPTLEPYQKRIAHGLILGLDNQKMSKSKGNVINPDTIVQKYGADTLRAYIMFIGPYSKESPWSTSGVSGVYRFLNRLRKNHKLVSSKDDSNELLVKLNQTIKSVTSDLEDFALNTAIAHLMELNNLIEKEKSISLASYKKYLQILYPFIPHITSELWEASGVVGGIEESGWPQINDKYLNSQDVNIAIQINGKTRAVLKVTLNSRENDIIDKVKEEAKSYLANKKINKTIYVAGRIVNFVIE